VFIRNKFQPITRNADVEGSGGTEIDGNTTTTTAEPADTTAGNEDPVQKLIEKAVADAVAGLRKKNEEVIGKNKQLNEQLTAAKAKPTLTEEEYASYASLKEKMERDEMLRLFAEGKSEEVIERVTKRTRLDAEAKLAAEAEARVAKEREASEWKTRYEQTMVNVEIARATAGSTVKPAYADLVAKLISDRVKLVDGAVRVVNADGEIEMTGNGTKPLTVADAVEMLRSSYSDLFATSSGGGAGGSPKKGPGSSNKLAMEAAERLSMADYARLRSEGKI
jgi:hypothetical protein